MSLLNITLAQQRHPRLFECLRAAGWLEDRDVPIPDQLLNSTADLGFFSHDYQEEFLRSFGGLQVRTIARRDRTGFPIYYGFDVGFGLQLDLMNARDHIGYIRRIAGTSRLFPIIMSGGDVVFALDDGRCLAIEVSFRGCIWAADPFDMMDWSLFTVRGPGFDVRELTMKERPPIFRW